MSEPCWTTATLRAALDGLPFRAATAEGHGLVAIWVPVPWWSRLTFGLYRRAARRRVVDLVKPRLAVGVVLEVVVR